MTKSIIVSENMARKIRLVAIMNKEAGKMESIVGYYLAIDRILNVDVPEGALPLFRIGMDRKTLETDMDELLDRFETVTENKETVVDTKFGSRVRKLSYTMYEIGDPMHGITITADVEVLDKPVVSIIRGCNKYVMYKNLKGGVTVKRYRVGVIKERLEETIRTVAAE